MGKYEDLPEWEKNAYLIKSSTASACGGNEEYDEETIQLIKEAEEDIKSGMCVSDKELRGWKAQSWRILKQWMKENPYDEGDEEDSP